MQLKNKRVPRNGIKVENKLMRNARVMRGREWSNIVKVNVSLACHIIAALTQPFLTQEIHLFLAYLFCILTTLFHPSNSHCQTDLQIAGATRSRVPAPPTPMVILSLFMFVCKASNLMIPGLTLICY